MCGLASLPAPLPSFASLCISLLHERKHTHTHRFPFPELCFENRSFILTVNSQADRYSLAILSIIKPLGGYLARYTCYCGIVSPRWSGTNRHNHTHEECRITHVGRLRWYDVNEMLGLLFWGLDEVFRSLPGKKIGNTTVYKLHSHYRWTHRHINNESYLITIFNASLNYFILCTVGKFIQWFPIWGSGPLQGQARLWGCHNINYETGKKKGYFAFYSLTSIN